MAERLSEGEASRNELPADVVTSIVREADEEFVKAGGSSRHWVRDHFLPLLDAAGYEIVEKTENPTA